jgi:outer membrane protein assembly factor BamA
VRRRFNLHAAALLVLCAPLGIRAQAPGQSSSQNSSKTATIETITVTGNQKFPSDQIIAASGLKPGDVVTAEQIQAAANRLIALGIFSAVHYRYSSKEDTISLEFQVQEATTYPLSFDNFPWFTDEEIAQAVRQKVGLFTGQAPGSGAMLDEISGAIEKLLASRKIEGDITHQLMERPVADGMMIQFRVDVPGLKIQSVQFGDSLAADSEQLKDRVPDIKGQPYSRFALEVFENEQVLPVYISKGYLRAKIGPPQAKLTIDTTDPNKLGVDVLIPIARGPVYTLGGLAWQGNLAIASANLDGAVEIKSGDPVDGVKMEAVWQNIKSAYGSRGYLDVKLDPQSQFDDAAHRVSYHVSIVEGPQYRMGEMVVTGLSVEAEKRLRQDWQIAPGQVFDNNYFEKLAEELAKPSAEIFGEMPVHYTEFGHWLRRDPGKHTVDVLLDFK